MTESPYIHVATADTFDALVLEGSKNLPVLVDFWATWCGPCQSLMPVLENLATDYAGKFHLVKVNADEQQDLAGRFAVRSLPTVKLFRHGEVVGEFLGAQPESAIRALLDPHMERASDTRLIEAREAAAAGDTGQARQLLQQALDDDTDNQRVRLELAELCLQLSDLDRVQELLQELPADTRDGPDGLRLRARLSLAEIAAGEDDLDKLQQAISDRPDDIENRHRYAARAVLDNEMGKGMEQFLEIMRRDRSYGDDAGRKGLLLAFNLLDDGDPLIGKYRSRMSTLLY